MPNNNDLDRQKLNQKPSPDEDENNEADKASELDAEAKDQVTTNPSIKNY